VFNRNVKDKLYDSITDTPVIMIVGARQVGKTTLARSIKDNVEVQNAFGNVTLGYLISPFANSSYITFDDANALSIAKKSPQDFIANLSKPIIIDEVQLCPEILPAIKQIVDNNRIAGQFILTGSANVLTLPKVSESLAGRIEVLNLRTLSQNEIEGNTTNFIDKLFSDDFSFPTNFPTLEREDFLNRMLIGGYPEIISRKSETRRNDWFKSYITTILQRDVRDLANIEGLIDLPRLLSLLASRSANLLNIAEVSRSMGFPQMTVSRYMTLLEKVFLIENVPAWSGSLKSRLVKSPKIFITDTGLLSYLQGLNLKKIQNEPTLAGSLSETFVVTELKKHLAWSKTHAEIYHFRTSNDKEVDVVLENLSGELVGIEIKSSSSINKNDFKGLHLLADSVPTKFKRGIILYSGNQFLSFGKNMFLVPINALWKDV
jgi:uncharacterized protein